MTLYETGTHIHNTYADVLLQPLSLVKKEKIEIKVSVYSLCWVAAESEFNSEFESEFDLELNSGQLNLALCQGHVKSSDAPTRCPVLPPAPNP